MDESIEQRVRRARQEVFSDDPAVAGRAERELTQALAAKKSVSRLGVFFSYFGGKFMRAPHYPKPLHDTIIEPFAGAAGYATRYCDRRVTLVDKSPYVCGVWRFLIGATRTDIMSLPLLSPGDDVRALSIPQEAQWLLGFWINQGSSVPKRTMGGRASNRQFGTWGEAPRERLAMQVEAIKHWKVIEGDYTLAPDVEATWFIDPTYQNQGKQYPERVTDFVALAAWCRSRRGQVMVCESEGADWLPFKPITTVAGATHRITTEMLWQPRWGSRSDGSEEKTQEDQIPVGRARGAVRATSGGDEGSRDRHHRPTAEEDDQVTRQRQR